MERAVAFSGAKKRQQLQERRAKHKNKLEEQRRIEKENDPFREETKHTQPSQKSATGVDAYNGRFVNSFGKQFKPEANRGGNIGGGGRSVVAESANHASSVKIRSVFLRRSAMEIKKSRFESMKPLEFLPESALEVSFEEMFPSVIGFPTRPKWDYSMNREALDRNEKRMFEDWMDSVYEKYPAEELSYFEHNLDVWRQLWRVLEISDIIMIIVDIRHPVIHFPPSLYKYVVNDMKRKLVVVFNKVDLVAPNTVFAWTQYFKEKFPELHVATFSCYPPDPNLINDSSTASLKKVAKRPRKRYYNAVGVKDVLIACKDVEVSKNGDQVDWDTLIAQYDKAKETEYHESDDDDQDTKQQKDRQSPDNQDEKLVGTLKTVNIEDDEIVPHSDYVTIGVVGHPNVGKSSLINSIMGRTVVSTSRTPGHTKHFQTIHLTHNVRLCDSPGLVFPSLLPKPLQILSGMFPIAQVQEPYSVIQYLAERVNIPRLLKLEPPPTYVLGPFRWSAFGICESFGLQRGFMTAKTSYPDAYRAANAMLQMANDGRILLSFKPPGFFTSTKYEQLRVNEADAAVLSTTDDEDREEENEDGLKDHDVEDSDEEEEEEEDEDEEEEMHKKGSKFQVNSRVGGFFGLLQDDDGDENEGSEDSDDDDDEDITSK